MPLSSMRDVAAQCSSMVLTKIQDTLASLTIEPQGLHTENGRLLDFLVLTWPRSE